MIKTNKECVFKNLFAKENRALRSTAEDVLGKSLEKGESPCLLRRPCERWLSNFRSLKDIIIVSELVRKSEKVRWSFAISSSPYEQKLEEFRKEQ